MRSPDVVGEVGIKVDGTSPREEARIKQTSRTALDRVTAAHQSAEHQSAEHKDLNTITRQQNRSEHHNQTAEQI